MSKVNRKLLIGHNMWFDGFRFARELGGLACPSIAIFASDIGFSNFGQMTFLIDPKTFDPKKVPTFESDVYSVRMPRPIFVINEKAKKIAQEKINSSLNQIGIVPGEINTIVHHDDTFEKGMEEVLFKASEDTPLMLTYLSEIGEDIVVPRMKIKPPITWLTDETFRELVDSGLLSGIMSEDAMFAITDIILRDFNKSLDDLLIKIFFDNNARSCSKDQLEEKRQSSIAQGHTSSYFKTVNGKLRIQYSVCDNLCYFFNRNKKAILANADVIDIEALSSEVKSKINLESYNQWAKDFLRDIPHKPYFMKNGRKTAFTIEALQKHMKGGIQAVDNNVFVNAGNIRSLISTRLNTHKQISGKAQLLVDDKTFSEFKDASNQALQDWPDKLSPYYRFEVNSFHYRSAVYDEILDYTRTGMNIQSLKESFKIDIMPSELINDLNAFIGSLKNAPTKYFEAKYQRIVDFSEFAAVMVPNNTPKDILLDLNAMGLKVVGYNADDKMDRINTLNRFESLMMNTDHQIDSILGDKDQNITSLTL